MSLVRAVTLSAALLAAAQAAAAQAQPTKFTIKVENISRGEVLKLSNGKTAPFVSAPVLWAVSGGSTNPLFVCEFLRMMFSNSRGSDRRPSTRTAIW